MSVAIESPVFIVFEGLDGSGKTTLARLVADALGALYMQTPSETVRVFRDEIIESFTGDQEAAQLFYLSTVFAASTEVERHLGAGRSVVLDRYFLSTQAYAEFRGSKLRLDDFAELLVSADLTVFLDAPLDVRRQRIVERGGASAADRETLHPEADSKLRELHVAKSALPVVGDFMHIESSAPPQAVAGAIIDKLGRFDPTNSKRNPGDPNLAPKKNV